MSIYGEVGGAWVHRQDEGISVRHTGVWKPAKRVWLSVWEFPEGEDPVHRWELVEDFAPPDVQVPNANAEASGTQARATWTDIDGDDDPRKAYGVQVVWHDDATGLSIPGAEDNVPQNNGATTFRSFPPSVQNVFAQVRYTNSYGLGPTVLTNSVFVGGV